MAFDVPKFTLPTFALPELRLPDIQLARDHLAHIASLMEEFQKVIGPEREVGLRGLFGDEPIYVNGRPRHSGNMVLFAGHTAAGEPVLVVQHYLHAAFLFVSLPRRTGGARTGFELPDDSAPNP